MWSNAWNSLLVLVCAPALATVVASSVWNRYRRGGLQTPPGPVSLPIFGNILGLLRKEKWELLSQYKQAYGDIVYLHGLGNSIVVLNTMQAIEDLLGKRAAKYSQRPVLTVVGELMGLDQSTVLRQNDAEWRLHRRFAHSVLSLTAVKQYHHVQEDLARRLCVSLLGQPEGFNAAIRLFSGRVVVGVTYGLSVEAADSQYIKHADATMDLVCRASVPGAYLCDLVPFLKYLPSWMPFQKEAAVGKEMIEKLVTMPFEHVKKDMSNGLAAPSLTQNLLSMDRDGIPDFEHAVKWTTGSMYGAMALNPEVQARAQAEIDRVVGSQRMPVIADKSELPYVNAVIKETMRWRPIVPLTLGRRSADDDLYRGFFIPRGAMVVPNVWAVAFEENTKYNPQQFIPERFLDPTQNVVDPASWAFGFGKRICPGKALGENSVFIAIASILWAFKISPPDNGILNPRFTHKLISLPEPFECKIVPRSDERSSLLLQQLV